MYFVAHCTGYVLTYLRAASAPEIVQLQSGMHQYVIEAPEPVEYTIYIAAVTRHGAGPTRFCTGEMMAAVYLLSVI